MKAPFQTLLLLFTALLVVFSTWPEIDLAVSALFHDAETGEWFGRTPLVEWPRQLIWWATRLFALAALVSILLALWRPARFRVPTSASGFALLAMLIGPGLLVNGVLKEFWGRVRPVRIAEFGGDGTFTPAFRMAGECTSNCSFVSGEAAGAATMALVLWLLMRQTVAAARRTALAAALLAIAALVALMRVMAGGHFLSDVSFAALLSVALTFWLHRLTGAPSLPQGAIRHDLGVIRTDFLAPLYRRFGRLLRLPGAGK